MPQLTLFALDRETADRLAREPVACAHEHALTRAPDEAMAVAIASATGAMLARLQSQCRGVDTWRWKARRVA